MRTRSKSYPFNSNATIPRRSNRRRVLNIVKPEIYTIEDIVPMADRTMEELLQAPTNLLQLYQANEFHGFERDNPYTHISNFKRMTATLKYRDVPNDAIKLMLFPYSLEGAARIRGAHSYYDCIPTDSNQPSFCVATGSYNQVSLPNRASHQIPPPGFAPNNQGYRAQMNNASNFPNQGFQNQPFSVPNNQIQLGMPNELSPYMKSNEIMIKSMQNQINILRGDFNKQEENLRRNLKDDMGGILGSFFQNQASTSGTLLSNTVPNPKGEMKVVTTRSGLAYEGPLIPTNSPLEKVDEQNTKETTDKEHCKCPGSTTQVQPPVVPISILEPNVPRTQPKPTIPYPSRPNDQKLCEKATNQMEKFFQIFHDLHFDISFLDALLLMPKFASTIKSLLTNKDKLFELVKVPLNENCSAMLLKNLPEKLRDPGKFLIPCDFPGMGVCHALADLGASNNLMPLSIWKKISLPELTPTRMTLELADRSITRLKGVFKDVFVKVGKFHFPTDFVVVDFEVDLRVPLILGRSYLRTGRVLIDVYGEEITLRYNPKSSNPTLVFDSLIPESDFSKEPIVKTSSPTLTPFRESDFFLEEIEDFLNDASIPMGIENSVYDPEGDILFLEKLLNEDPFQLPPMDLKLAEETKAKSSIEEPPELELKELPPWVSPIHCVPKKGGMTVVANENNELIPMRLVTGWRVCIDYRKLNDATRKNHFSLPFMDQMLERLVGNEFYCFLDGFSGPMTHLLEKETPFVFSKECIDALNILKKKLTEASILVVSDWNIPFELMCDASDFAIGAVLGQRKTKHFQPIHYASKTMTDAQIHYTTTEKEMLAVVYAFEKFRPYLVLSKSIVYTDHSALKYLLNKQDAKPRLLRWVLLLQEFDITILDTKGYENLAADHLSRLENPHKDVLENKEINKNFSLENL
nr:hypothetical protein [Tanacetum cinerariifolium]